MRLELTIERWHPTEDDDYELTVRLGEVLYALTGCEARAMFAAALDELDGHDADWASDVRHAPRRTVTGAIR